MMTLSKKRTELIKDARELTWEEFKELHCLDDSDYVIYRALGEAKEGKITITKVSDNPGYLGSGQSEWGYTNTFAVGISLFIENNDRYYHTSIIESIDWENCVFKTKNSTYTFAFMEYKPSIQVPVVKTTTNALPKYETTEAAGMDVRANLVDVKAKFLFNSVFNVDSLGEPMNITINPGGRCLVPTGLFVALPKGYECQVRPRSGLALKHGITVLNTPGTIDSDYRGEIGIIVINHGTEPFVINPGDRIAQLVIAKVEQASWREVAELPSTERAGGGFGHSDVK